MDHLAVAYIDAGVRGAYGHISRLWVGDSRPFHEIVCGPDTPI